MALHALVLSLT